MRKVEHPIYRIINNMKKKEKIKLLKKELAELRRDIKILVGEQTDEYFYTKHNWKVQFALERDCEKMVWAGGLPTPFNGIWGEL
jgi:hypothetical protein